MKEINIEHKTKFAKISTMPKPCYDALTDAQKKEVQDHVKGILKDELMTDNSFWECIMSQMKVEETEGFGLTPEGDYGWVHKYGCSLWVDNIDPTVIVKMEN